MGQVGEGAANRAEVNGLTRLLASYHPCLSMALSPIHPSSVACDCDRRLIRAVEPGGGTLDVYGCMKCGVVTVSDAVWHEPHPHVVYVDGYRFVDVPPEVLAWLGQWPRVIWTGGTVPRYLLAASARAGDPAALEALELAERREQETLTYRARLLRAGVPSTPPPAGLPKNLASFSQLWSALQLADDTPLDILVAHTPGWGVTLVDEIFLRRETHEKDLLDLLCDPDVTRREAGYGIVGRQHIASEPVLRVLDLRLQASDHGPQELHRLLIAVSALGGEARELAPTLRALAEKAKGDYYLHKRLTELAAVVGG
jgi:hypothetical protein